MYTCMEANMERTEVHAKLHEHLVGLDKSLGRLYMNMEYELLRF